MKWLSPSSLLVSLAAPGALLLSPFAAQAWQTNPDPQPVDSPFHMVEPYPWVFFEVRVGQVGQTQYPGTWLVTNSWPGSEASVTIRHKVTLSNSPYYPTGQVESATYPFGTQGGDLTVSALNMEENGAVYSSLKHFRFKGPSTWSGGFIAGGNSNQFPEHAQFQNQGELVIAAPATIGTGGALLNTDRISIPTTLWLQIGFDGLTNQSGQLPDPSTGEITLTQPGSAIAVADGNGGSPIVRNYGIIRKTGGGTSNITTGFENYANSPLNRAGTVAVNSGTLVINPFAPAQYHGLKAELAPGAVLLLTGDQRMNPGTTTVTGGGILRVGAGAFLTDPAVTGGAVLHADEGAFECAGADMRDLVNTGSINITVPSIWRGMTNKGHVRLMAGLQLGAPSSNGTADSHTAVFEMEGSAGFSAINIPPVFNNYALLRKTGGGASELRDTTLNVYGSASAADSGALEVKEGTLKLLSYVYFLNGGRVRVANGATLQLLGTTSLDGGGTLTVTGSGKVRHLPGAALRTATPETPPTFNAAPGTFEFDGGQVNGPLTNVGEIMIAAPTSWGYSFFGTNVISNSGTIHMLATSAGSGGNSLALNALVGMDCQPSGILMFDIAGRPDQPEKWARMVLNGQTFINYGGKLRINFGDFTPVSGDRWKVITLGSEVPGAANFSSAEFTNVPAGFTPMYEKLSDGYRVGLDAAPAPKTFAQWAAAQSFATPAAADYGADPDGDGWSNGLEASLGTDPKSAASKPAGQIVRYDSGGDLFFGLQFTRPGGPNRLTDIQYIGERSDTLSGWTADGVIVESGPLDAQGNETIMVRLAEPFDYHRGGFLRLRAQK